MDTVKNASYYGVIIVLLIFIVGWTGLFIYQIVHELDITRNGVKVVGKIYKVGGTTAGYHNYYIKFKLDRVEDESLVTVINARAHYRGKVNDSVTFYYVQESGRSEFVVDSGFTVYFFWPVLIITVLIIILIVGLKNPSLLMDHWGKGDGTVSG